MPLLLQSFGHRFETVDDNVFEHNVLLSPLSPKYVSIHLPQVLVIAEHAYLLRTEQSGAAAHSTLSMMFMYY